MLIVNRQVCPVGLKSQNDRSRVAQIELAAVTGRHVTIRQKVNPFRGLTIFW